MTSEPNDETEPRLLILKELPKQKCPVHGEHDNTVSFVHNEFVTGPYCIHCAIEKMEELGVCKMEDVVEGSETEKED